MAAQTREYIILTRERKGRDGVDYPSLDALVQFQKCMWSKFIFIPHDDHVSSSQQVQKQRKKAHKKDTSTSQLTCSYHGEIQDNEELIMSKILHIDKVELVREVIY